jgi:hypothetical protein
LFNIFFLDALKWIVTMHIYHVTPHQFILTLTTLELYAAHKVFCQLQILSLRFKLNDICSPVFKHPVAFTVHTIVILSIMRLFIIFNH